MRRSVTFIARVDTSPGATSGTATDMYGSKETDTFWQLGHTTVDLKKPSKQSAMCESLRRRWPSSTLEWKYASLT